MPVTTERGEPRHRPSGAEVSRRHATGRYRHTSRSTGRRRRTITSSAIGGAVVGGILVGLPLGPFGAFVGMMIGGAAGEIYDRRGGPDVQGGKKVHLS